MSSDYVKEILTVADEIEADFNYIFDDETVVGELKLRNHLKQIRLICKFAAQEALQQVTQHLPSYLNDPQVQHRHFIEEAKKEFRKGKESIPQKENSVRMVEVVGGPSDSVMFSIDTEVPVGTKTFVAGAVYELEQDDKLHYREQETLKARNQQ